MKTVYLVGRPKDLNNTMSLCHDGVRIVLPNYTKVDLEPPKKTPGDVSIFELRVNDEKLRVAQENDRSGRRQVARLWEGPENRRDLPQMKVSAIIRLYADGDQGAADGESDPHLDQVRKANEDLLEKVGELTQARDRLAKPDEAALREIIANTDPAVLETMPYIGPESVTHLQAWARGD